MTGSLRHHQSRKGVSIHTPTWGVTLQGLPRAPIGRVSIHTPTWGVTIGATPAFQFGVFQSTHLHEVWLLVSQRWCSDCRFNPHTYMRCDALLLNNWGYEKGFNPHTYMRCDCLTASMQRTRNSSFNPHTYMRCDAKFMREIDNIRVSIHTPTWGVTESRVSEWRYKRVSIHTPTWGVTPPR